ncbi:alpha 1,2-mannosyltransferase 2.4.1, partial [Friedmanniomyces endolithicus]
MAGSQRVFRYVLLAVVALVVIFFVSASSGVGPGSGYTQKASELLKGQGSIYEGSGSNSVPAAGQDSKAGSGSNANPIDVVKSVVAPLQTAASSNTHDTTSPNPLSSTSSNPPLGQTAPGPRMNATFVTLARNSDVWEISGSIRQVEDRFNH